MQSWDAPDYFVDGHLMLYLRGVCGRYMRLVLLGVAVLGYYTILYRSFNASLSNFPHI